MNEQWYERVYRRHVIDVHITGDDASHMSQLDAQRYAGILVLS